jgi:hypothetical protein
VRYFAAMTARRVEISGTGVAALCCQQLLGPQGHATNVAGQAGSDRPWFLLISQVTQKLLADLFGSSDLFAGLPRIRQRTVAWSGKLVTLPHDGAVISESALGARLRARLHRPQAADLDPESGWSILTSQSALTGSPLDADSVGAKCFGARTGRIHPVELARAAEPETCWVESTPTGWLFVLTTSPGAGSLLSVGAPAESLLQQSRLIAAKIQRLQPLTAEVPVYPRILETPCAPGWLACGSAAIAFDPLCGEGAGHATREAILASAAVGAILAEESVNDVLAEYATRLRLGFLRHLENCRAFYTQDSPSDFWRAELHQLDEGLAWTRSQLAAAGPPAFRLTGFTLERSRRDDPQSIRLPAL